MRLYLTAKTSIPDLFIDYIQGVYFDEEHANGRIEELRDMKITDIGVYFESKHEQDIKIEVMDFVDDDKQLVFSSPELIQEGCVTVG